MPGLKDTDVEAVMRTRGAIDTQCSYFPLLSQSAHCSQSLSPATMTNLHVGSLKVKACVTKHGALRLTSTEMIRLISDGEKVGEGGMEVGVERGRLYIYLSLHCHHQKDSCIEMGSDESHFNAS